MTKSPVELRARAHEASGHLPGLILSAERLSRMIAPGAHGIRRAGMGEDFWQYRPATYGESSRNIDWRRSARSDAQFVRDHEVQTAQAVGLWVSGGQGMNYSGAPDRPTKSVRAQVLALALALVLLRGGEKVGLIGHAARTGSAQANRIAALLAGASLATTDTDTPQSETIRPNQRLVIISDFLDDPAWVQSLLTRATGLGVRGILMQVLDPDEEVFPYSGAVEFRSISGAMRHDSRDAGGLRQEYLRRLAQRRDWLQSHAQAAGWHFNHHRTDHAPAHALGWLYQVLEG